MAGGIDWFRWHHGSVTDPKFQLVAKKSKASIAEVIAVWAFILESASASHDRGNFGEIDCDAVDCLYGMADGQTKAILSHMKERGLIADNSVCNWTKRQPKREDETSAERKRRQRERDHELELASNVTSNVSRNVTHSHAGVTHGHDRGEESREDKRREEVIPPKSPKGESVVLPDWMPLDAWEGFSEMRNRIKKPMTHRAKGLIVASLGKMRERGIDVKDVLDASTRNGWQDVYEPKVVSGRGNPAFGNGVAL